MLCPPFKPIRRLLIGYADEQQHFSPRDGSAGAPSSVPGYMPQPPGPPSDNGRRRWPILFAAGIIGAVIASAAAAGITVQARDTTAATPEVACTGNCHRRGANSRGSGTLADLAGRPPNVPSGVD